MPQPRNLTPDTPLTVEEQHFLANYIRLGNFAEAIKTTPEYNSEGKTPSQLSHMGQHIFNKVHIQAEYKRMAEEARKETQATAKEVLEYFTKVMRGEIKDQFGLEAPLSERTKAAQERAKRTVDIENRKSGEPDQLVAIKLDWSRD